MRHELTRHGSNVLSVARLASVAEWISAARAPASVYCKDRDSRSWPTEWNGNVSFDEACRLASDGWTEGRNRISRNLATVKAAQAVEAPQLGYDVAGGFPDIARAVAGDPCCMIAPAEPVYRRRVLTVRLWVGILGDVEPAAVIAWGAAAASYVDALEASGCAIDLYAVAVARSTRNLLSRYHALSVSLKGPDQPLDLDRLAFAAGHPAAHRRLNFAVRETAPQMLGKLGGTIQPDACPQWIRDALAVDGPAIDIPSAGVCGATDPIACAAFMARYFTALDARPE